MSRKLALPLFLLVFALCVIFASRTPQPIIEELPPEEAEAPAVLLTKTEEVGGQAVTLKVYEPDEEGIARYALFGADGTEIDIPFGVDRGTWIGNGDVAEKVGTMCSAFRASRSRRSTTHPICKGFFMH